MADPSRPRDARARATGALGRAGALALNRALGRLGPRGALDALLRAGPYGRKPFARAGLTLDDLARTPEGIDLGPLTPRMPGVLRNREQRIQLAPPPLVADLDRAERILASRDRAATIGELLLIGRRQLRSNNSWMHNSARLVRGRDRCTLLMNPSDARERAIGPGTRVRISSRAGAIEASVELSDEIMRGVISLPHGFGHDGDGVRLRVAREHAGVSVNDITDDRAYDAVSGTSAAQRRAGDGAVRLIPHEAGHHQRFCR